ncbi:MULTISPECIES: carbonic anhydrase [unclassified Anabaena]|uniref:carbonic anhydrase n=1 Tax=unclassified Anabaena TaxID=2619674 RepID=UPI001446FE39|nr:MULTISPECIES: carbonic anhydrase [unclassified Anabaena]MTJ06931.1 carbonic anhydrase [Anabaena sp. UHCC 0204]MTJ54832.1 carbonic anhydrase [Anabaena sp. UHCC 0253]
MSRINGFIGRRNFLKVVGLSSFSIATITACNRVIERSEETVISDTKVDNPQPVNANEAIRRLLAGNQRFVNQKQRSSQLSPERLKKTAQAQYPFAAILGCADSRVPTETIFDQGIGDLFVVRVAGNVANDVAIGSLEYSTAVLGSQLIVVLGHQNCGAVKAAMQTEPAPGRIGIIIEQIKPALRNTKLNENNTNNAVIANINYQIQKMQKSSVILDKLVKAGKLKIIGAFYNLATGKIDFINQ